MARQRKANPEQVFIGELTEKELDLIEAALENYKDENTDVLIMKLYKFWEK
jgi:CRISPR/Cas system-associated endoribonuclease Cas2